MNKKTVSLFLVLALITILAVSYFAYHSFAEKNGNPTTTTTTTEEKSNGGADFTVYDAEGNAVTLSSFEGKPVIINFFATWCGYCKIEMPDFQDAYETYGEDVQFVFINSSHGSAESNETVEDFMAENGYDFPVYYDKSGEAATVFSLSGVPATYGLDAEGNLMESHPGMMLAEDLEALVNYVLK